MTIHKHTFRSVVIVVALLAALVTDLLAGDLLYSPCVPCFGIVEPVVHDTTFLFNSTNGQLIPVGGIGPSVCMAYLSYETYDCGDDVLRVKIKNMCVSCGQGTNNDLGFYMRNLLLRLHAPDDPLGIYGMSTKQVVEWIGFGCSSISKGLVGVPAIKIVCIAQCQYEDRVFPNCCIISTTRYRNACTIDAEISSSTSDTRGVTECDDWTEYVPGLIIEASSNFPGYGDAASTTEETVCYPYCLFLQEYLAPLKQRYTYEIP